MERAPEAHATIGRGRSDWPIFTSLLVSLRAHLPAFDAVTTPLYISAWSRDRAMGDIPGSRGRRETPALARAGWRLPVQLHRGDGIAAPGPGDGVAGPADRVART